MALIVGDMLTGKIVNKGVDEEHGANSPERRGVAGSEAEEANGEERDEEDGETVDKDGAAAKVGHEEPGGDRANEADGICKRIGR